MQKPTFGWVITPNAPDKLQAASLMQDNKRFIERIRGKFNTIWVEDHLQWGNEATLECWTALIYLAARYPDFTFGPLVLGQSYRNPALTAKMMATLYWLSGGRMIAGIGAGWKQDEYEAYGWPYPSAQIRIEQLEDTVQIMKAMWTQSPATFEGKHYAIYDAYCEPRPNPLPPLLIAGGGERYTLHVVVKHADWMNVGFEDVATYRKKLVVLRGHCDEVGRNYREITKTYYAVISLSEKSLHPRQETDYHIVQGTPDQVTEELQEFVKLGVSHFMINFNDFPSDVGLNLFLEEVYPALITNS
jgi:alkanesulfonate monooxygenase SsuD/methylene tetrahydromethanopterin reductase-like flavin-dependent oxidoreductase (luciferase family)